MKKSILGLVFAIVATFMFTGCTTTQVNFQKTFIEKNVKNDTKKVTVEKVQIKPQEKNFIKKSPTTLRAKLTKVDVDMASVNGNVLKSFFAQYFNNVEFSSLNDGSLFVDSQFTDYNYNYGAINDGNEVEVFITVKAYYKNELILDKNYSLKNDTTMISFAWTRGIQHALQENMHKTLLEIYETKMKPDLVLALEKR